jgi:hypothetical protein
MSIDPKMLDALTDRMESACDLINKQMDLLLLEMDRVLPAERSGPDWGPSGSFAKRLMDLNRQLGDIGRKQVPALTAFENVPSKAKN